VKLTRIEKFMLVGCPWFFGTILIVVQIFGVSRGANPLYTLILIPTGLILISIYCVCALLVKLIEK